MDRARAILVFYAIFKFGH